MLSKTKIVLITALVLGSASVAFAYDDYDNRYPAYHQPIATQRAAAQSQRGFVRRPVFLRAGVGAPLTAGTQSSGYHANADLKYGPQLDYPQSPAGGGY
jgi:hypothetical protein